MSKYSVKIFDEAKDDIKRIIKYIKVRLKEPKIAKQHSEVFKKEILKLKDMADIYSTIDNEISGKTNIRKVNVKNFMIFYRIIDEIKEVQIIAVYYSGSSWQKNIKYK